MEYFAILAIWPITVVVILSGIMISTKKDEARRQKDPFKNQYYYGLSIPFVLPNGENGNILFKGFDYINEEKDQSSGLDPMIKRAQEANITLQQPENLLYISKKAKF